MSDVYDSHMTIGGKSFEESDEAKKIDFGYEILKYLSELDTYEGFINADGSYTIVGITDDEKTEVLEESSNPITDERNSNTATTLLSKMSENNDNTNSLLAQNNELLKNKNDIALEGNKIQAILANAQLESNKIAKASSILLHEQNKILLKSNADNNFHNNLAV